MIISFVLLCGSCGLSKRERTDIGETERMNDSIRRENDLGIRAEAIADSILARMTLEEKAAQLMMPALFSRDDAYTLKVLGEYGKKGVGGVVLLKGDSESARHLSDSLSKASAVIPFISIDAEWGLGMRLSDEPVYPVNSEVGKVATEEEMFRYGALVARQCREIGINMVLGPVLDVADSTSFMGRRSYGADPVRVSDLAVAYARGLESEGVMSVAKHFPGHGAATGDSHKKKPVVERTLHQMDSIDLYPFKKYIESGLSAVMVGHLAVPAIDPEMRPAAVSPTVINRLLVKDLGFDGLILTDALNMGGAEGNGADKAIEAGANMILAPVKTDSEIKRVVEAVSKGEIKEEELDGKVRKILFYKALMMLRRQKNKEKENKEKE